MAKVVIFHTPVRFGGGEKQLILISKEFLKNNLDFMIICLAKSNEFEEELRKNNINFITISNKELGDSPRKKDYLKHLFFLFFEIFNKNLRKIYREARIIWARDFPANFFVYLLVKILGKGNKKFIYSRHAYKNPEKGIVKIVYEKVLNNFDVILGISSFVSVSLGETFPKLKNKIITIPNGIDSSLFEITKSKEELRKELDLPINEILAIYVARFTPDKNHLFLLEILENVANFKIILIGDGETREEFLKEARRRNSEERVIYKGYMSPNLVPFYLKAADFCIFPSKKEGFSNAILEAMAAGLPVVIFKDIYSEEYGENILRALTKEKFIEYTKNLCENEELRKQLGELNKEFVKNNLDIRIVIKKYLEIFEK
jgi:glycosyltransferase involved in cell wall biosynthesis